MRSCTTKALTVAASSRVKTSSTTSFWPIMGVAPILPHRVASVSGVSLRSYRMPSWRCAACSASTEASPIDCVSGLLSP